ETTPKFSFFSHYLQLPFETTSQGTPLAHLHRRYSYRCVGSTEDYRYYGSERIYNSSSAVGGGFDRHSSDGSHCFHSCTSRTVNRAWTGEGQYPINRFSNRCKNSEGQSDDAGSQTS